MTFKNFDSKAYSNTEEDGTVMVRDLHGPITDSQRFVSNLPSQPETTDHASQVRGGRAEKTEQDSDATVNAPTSHVHSSHQRNHTGGNIPEDEDDYSEPGGDNGESTSEIDVDQEMEALRDKM